MYDPTVALAEQERKFERDEREARMLAARWQPCPTCDGAGHTRQVWHSDNGDAPWILYPDCLECDGSGEIEVFDPTYLVEDSDERDIPF